MNYILVTMMMFQAAHHPQHKVYLLDQVSTTGNVEAYSNAANGRESDNHTAPGVMAELSKRCSSVPFTEIRQQADLIVELASGEARVVDRKGSVLFVSHAKTVSSKAKDVCSYLSAH